MHNSIQTLFEEHTHIMGAIQTSKDLRKLIGKQNIIYGELVLELLRFFRNYADKYHHFKEEEVLFPEMSKRNEMLASGVIAEMLDNHTDFRELIGKIEKSVLASDFEPAQILLEQYGESLLNHIAAENEEVFVTAESILNLEELDKIHFRFEDCDRNLGLDTKKDWVHQLNRIQYRLSEY